MRRMLVRFTAVVAACVCAIAMCFPGAALAEDAVGSSFSENGMTFKVTRAGEVALGDGTAGRGVETAVVGSSVVIPESVNHNGSTYTVTSINIGAFSGITSIESISIPSTVRQIEKSAFSGCGVMDDSGPTPCYRGLKRISFVGSPSLKYIGDDAFSNSYALESFVIPATVVSIGKRAFLNCFSFTSLEFEEGTQITTLPEKGFSIDWQQGFAKPAEWNSEVSSKYEFDDFSDDSYADWDWAGSVTKSKSYGGLVSARIPASVKKIDWACFSNQRSMTSLVFDADTMDYINYFAFALCSSLKELELPGTGYVRTGDTEYESGYGDECFFGCCALEKVIFKGEILASDDKWLGCHMFDNCVSLKTVVFLKTKIVPLKRYTRFSSAHGDDSYLFEYGYNNCSPNIYDYVSFYESREDALAGSSLMGWALLREDVTPSEISENMAAADEVGSVVCGGFVPALPSGFDAWALVSADGTRFLSSNDAVDGILRAFPIKSTNLSFGGLVLSSSSYWCDGMPHQPEVTVLDALGHPLDSSCYKVTWERQRDDGSWESTTDYSSAGAVRCVASGVGIFNGACSRQYSIALLEEGASIEWGGITFVVSKAQTSTSSAELQVGDGEQLAVSEETQGVVTIPASVRLEGSELVLPVTSIASKAFGSNSGSCCDLITEIVLPEGITSIGDMAFANASSLKSVTIPAAVDSIGASAFDHCVSLTELNFEGSSVRRIGTSAFGSCARLKEVVLPAVTESLLGLAFQNCVMLRSVTFSGSVVGGNLGQFNGCERLESVSFSGAFWSYKWTAGTRISAVGGSKSSKALYSFVVGKKYASYDACLASGSTATVPAKVSFGDSSYAVGGIAPNAFKQAKAKQLTVQATSLSKAGVKGCLKGSKVSTVKVPGKKKTAYKKIFVSSVVGKKVAIK